jgi:hypothetical protein
VYVPLYSTASQLVRSVFQSIMGAYEGAFSAEPAAGDHAPTGGLGRPGEPVVGPPTHPVMPNLVMLWEISPLRGGVRAGTRLDPVRAKGTRLPALGPPPLEFC